MDKMRMPGFSAEASLYQSGAHYRAGVTLAGLRQGGEIIPQMQCITSPAEGWALCCSRVRCCYCDAGGCSCF